MLNGCKDIGKKLAAAQGYEHWCDVGDEEALEIFRRQKWIMSLLHF